MKFQKTVELWGKEQAILSNKLVLQCGQWVTCGGSKSRYIGHNGRSIDVVHGGNTKEVCNKFKQRLTVAKERLTFY